MITVVFTKDFATKKKGDEAVYDNSLASRLINVRKVAKLKKVKKSKDK